MSAAFFLHGEQTMRARLLLLLHAATATFCGNYCGMYYCGGGLHLGDTQCDFSAAPNDFAGSCLDACCRAHDECCEDDARKPRCNAEMLACLDACESTDTTCLYGVLPIMKPALVLAMGVVEDACCGEAC